MNKKDLIEKASNRPVSLNQCRAAADNLFEEIVKIYINRTKMPEEQKIIEVAAILRVVAVMSVMNRAEFVQFVERAKQEEEEKYILEQKKLF